MSKTLVAIGDRPLIVPQMPDTFLNNRHDRLNPFPALMTSYAIHDMFVTCQKDVIGSHAQILTSHVCRCVLMRSQVLQNECFGLA